MKITEQNFGHHPLEFSEDKMLNEEHKPYLCSLCELPILSTPSYRCGNGCDIFLHESCVHLPKEVSTPLISMPLSLEPKPPRGCSNCRRCGKLCTNFVYSSANGYYLLHPPCATRVDMKIKHELVAICKEIVSRCDACGEKQEGLFFLCQECNFWIHQDCTLLPSIVKAEAHPHLLVLRYATDDYYDRQSEACRMCQRDFLGKGNYSCSQCDYVAHLSCATSNMEDLTFGQGFIHLPDEEDTVPSLAIRMLGNKRNPNDNKEMTMEKYHGHPLIFHESSKHGHQSSSSSRSTSTQSVCNACIQPITSSSFWGCNQSDCHFVLHDLCAKIPTSIISLEEPVSLNPKYRVDCFFHSTFLCLFCHRPCNGLGYIYDIDILVIGDVECSSAPNAMTHASHGRHHVLLLTEPPLKTITSCCPDQPEPFRLYSCVSCSFVIHVGCALLPKKVRHKFDKHLLELVFNSHDDRDIDELDWCFCEFCEEGIDRHYWFYYCDECDQYFHVKCIPSVGFLSKVKFGGTTNVWCHPRHPVTLTRMLMEGNQRCGYCEEVINGFVDEMAFYCEECEFWIHFSCARDCVTDQSSVLWYDIKRYNIIGPRFDAFRERNILQGLNFIYLPDEGDTFPCLTIRRIHHDDRVLEEDKKLEIRDYHNHSLIFYDSCKHDHQPSISSTSTQSVCNACIHPIVSSPFWGCYQSDCRFFLHDFCANIPPRIHSHYRAASLYPDINNYFFQSVFPCIFCRRPSNGFGYLYDVRGIDAPVLGDVECVSAPNHIKHASHSRHNDVLSLKTPSNWGTKLQFSCCSDVSIPLHIYECIICDFAIHLRCALLPRKVTHKLDKHPLNLIFTPPVIGEVDCCFCKEDIDRRYWFYRCAECDQSFHVKCIPSVGLLSKVKFGGTTNVSCHPDHPVTLTRMLMIGNQRCGYCKEVIKGCVDEMGFTCEECGFWIHFSCARDCSSDPTSSRQPLLWYDGTLPTEDLFVKWDPYPY